MDSMLVTLYPKMVGKGGGVEEWRGDRGGGVQDMEG